MKSGGLLKCDVCRQNGADICAGPPGPYRREGHPRIREDCQYLEPRCKECTRRETCCDMQRPTCGACEGRGAECQYEPSQFTSWDEMILERMSLHV